MNFGRKNKNSENNYPFQNPALNFEERADDLVARMSLKEKIQQMLYKAPAIPRLGILPYDWWNECLHGVGRAGIATVFPQAIGFGATFDADLIFRIATAISDEARAKHHEAQRRKDYGRYKGLTFWTPNINLFRDPRWGRGQETYGEDPYLTAQLGIAFIKGLQGDHPKYLKLVATPKHYVVHSGPEYDRHRFNAIANPKDLSESYLPHFKACIQEGKAESIMGAYNRTNGEVCCGSPTFLQKILREEWGFQGYVVSDCGAIDDFHRHHKVTKNAEESAALAVNNGCDLNCGHTFKALNKAVKKGLITEETITRSVRRLMLARLKLGMFDPPNLVPYQNIPLSVNDSPAHRELALQAALASCVLLKNENRFLPLDPTKYKTIAIIGPNANDKEVLLGNYNGTPSQSSTPKEGLIEYCRKNLPTIRILYTKGCDIESTSTAGFDEAINMANQSDLVILCLGLSAKLEGEQGIGHYGDREYVELPPIQQQLFAKIHRVGKPIVCVLLNGGPVSIPEIHEKVPAILEAWYPGEEGGTAIAQILFGKYSPGGRMPITTVEKTTDLAPLSDYNMQGRTYRFLTKPPLYPFGYGLSYTSFQYSNWKLSKTTLTGNEEIQLSGILKNTGIMTGDEVVQIYIKRSHPTVKVPHYSLRKFARIHLEPNEDKTLYFTLTSMDFSYIDDHGNCCKDPGVVQIYIGGSQPDDRSLHLTGNTSLKLELEII